MGFQEGMIGPCMLAFHHLLTLWNDLSTDAYLVYHALALEDPTLLHACAKGHAHDSVNLE